jgi:menaquinone-9 beta-reductase
MTYDLVVIGAGPGGCATAISAACKASSVLLLERGRYPRHRVCGEFVSAESLTLLSNLLSADQRGLITAAPRISQARVFADGSELGFEVNPSAASIPRYDLDLALWNSSLRAGVDVRDSCTVQFVEGEGPFAVTTTAEVFHARSIVNAAGRWSFLTSSGTRTGASGERWIGVKRHFSEPNPSASVDLYFFDGGYCGVQPVSYSGASGAGIVNASAMVRADIATDLNDVLERHPVLRDRSRSWEPVIDQVTTSPLVFHKPEAVQGKMLQVGDAATFVDPFIGDGISMALRSGALAAECMGPFFRNACSLEKAAAEYERLYSTRLAPVFRASSVLRKLLRIPYRIRKPALSLLQHTPLITRQIVRMTR